MKKVFYFTEIIVRRVVASIICAAWFASLLATCFVAVFYTAAIFMQIFGIADTQPFEFYNNRGLTENFFCLFSYAAAAGMLIATGKVVEFIDDVEG